MLETEKNVDIHKKLKAIEEEIKLHESEDWKQTYLYLRDLIIHEELFISLSVPFAKTFQIEENGLRKFMSIVQVQYTWHDTNGNAYSVIPISAIGVNEDPQWAFENAVNESEKSYYTLQFNLRHSKIQSKNMREWIGVK